MRLEIARHSEAHPLARPAVAQGGRTGWNLNANRHGLHPMNDLHGAWADVHSAATCVLSWSLHRLHTLSPNLNPSTWRLSISGCLAAISPDRRIAPALLNRWRRCGQRWLVQKPSQMTCSMPWQHRLQSQDNMQSPVPHHRLATSTVFSGRLLTRRLRSGRTLHRPCLASRSRWACSHHHRRPIRHLCCSVAVSIDALCRHGGGWEWTVRLLSDAC